MTKLIELNYYDLCALLTVTASKASKKNRVDYVAVTAGMVKACNKTTGFVLARDCGSKSDATVYVKYETLKTLKGMFGRTNKQRETCSVSIMTTCCGFAGQRVEAEFSDGKYFPGGDAWSFDADNLSSSCDSIVFDPSLLSPIVKAYGGIGVHVFPVDHITAFVAIVRGSSKRIPLHKILISGLATSLAADYTAEDKLKKINQLITGK